MRVVVADELGIFRSGVKSLLGRAGDFDVFEAATLDELVATAGDRSPDVALVDLNLPPAGGVAATTQLKQRGNVPVILWALDFTPEQVIEVARAGADGILHKQISPSGLVRALQGASRGEATVARSMTRALLSAVHGALTRSEAVVRTAELSDRERQVMSHLAAGARNREIANALGISEFTVKRHVQNILEKLELPSRGEAGALYDTAYGPQAELVRSNA